MKEVQIIQYQDKYHQDFKDANLHWLKKFNLYEAADDELLDNPNLFIKNGATIFLASVNNKIVGTICLNPIETNWYEILKFAVIDGFKGFGIGKKLMQTCIDMCIENNVDIITLESSSKLENALKLYEKFGFKHIDSRDSHFETADIKMELKLK